MPRAGWILGAALILVVGATVGALGLSDDSDHDTERTKHAARAVTPSEPATTTLPPLPPTTVAATAPPTEPPTASPGLSPTGDDRLSRYSRLGYAGLGPIKLGMTYAEVERVGQLTIREGDCLDLGFDLHPGSGLDPIPARYGGFSFGVGAMGAFRATNPRVIDVIVVGHPAISTISGIHVGSTAEDVLRTYSNAVATPVGQSAPGQTVQFITITNPEGRVVQFFVENGLVSTIEVASSLEILEGHRAC
jgi:hypothetical protein